MVTGDQSTELHQRPKLPVIAPVISEKEQPVQVCSIDVLPNHIPTVDVTERVNRPTRVVQEPSTSSQPMLTSASENEVELSGPSLDETPSPQPPRRRISSEEPLRVADFQASRNFLNMRNNPIGHTVFECKDPRCTRSKVAKELRFKIGEVDQPARSGIVVRGRGGRGRRVARCRGKGRGGHVKGHKGRGQYRPIYYINTQEETSSTSSRSENVSANSSMTSHRRIDRFSNRIRNTGNFPYRKQINAINRNQSIADFGNPVNNSPTAQQFLLNPLQFHEPSSDINSIFGINSTVTENHTKSQRSPFLRLEILINNIKMIATIALAAFCSAITEDLANKCNMSINRDDTIEFLPANNVSSKSLRSANDNQSSSPSDFEEQLIRSGWEIKLDDANNKLKITSLLEIFSDVFSETLNRKGINCNPLTIPFRDENAIVHKPARRLNTSKVEIANKIFDELIEMGYSVGSNYKFSSPIVLVIYPDDKKPRLTGDFSGKDGVNAHTISEPNLPRISDILQFLSSANYIVTLDLPKAFWQMNVAEKDIEKTSISIPGRLIMFKRACFELKNIPAVSQNVMMEIFQIDGVFIYMDDIIIVGTTFEEFYKRLQRVLQCARNRRVNIGLRKCKFVTSKHPIDNLGSTFQDKTRFISKKKIEALMRIPRPKSVKEVRSLVGSINFIRDWLPVISELIAPINELIKGKPRIIKWTNKHDDYFEQIKNLIINHMPLELPAPGKHVLISTDASDVAVRGVIWQEIEPHSFAGTALNKRKVKPLSFYSRLLKETQRKWSTLQKELYAILQILTESCLESYLLTRHLTIFTDHKNIAFLATAPEKNRIVKRWLPILSEFDFDIVHEPGEDNHWADMLSRNIDLDQNDGTASICSINIPDTLLSNYEIPPLDDDSDSDFEDIPSISSLSRHQDLSIFSFWFSKIRSEQQMARNNNDSLFENAILDENTQIWKNNKNKILIPKSLRKQALLLIHGLVQSTHPSKNDSLHKLSKSDFFWPNMRKDHINHIKRCPTCQKKRHQSKEQKHLP
ncbi:hypothetical protein P9112_007732 [Eukaryota sp. TZLM1-RC]